MEAQTKKEEYFEIPLGGNASADFIQKQYEENLAKRNIIFNDIVTDDLMEKLIMQIIKFNKEDQGKPVEMRQPIWLHINSDGGDVMSGLSVISTIKNSKTPIYAVCHKAASMAAYILISCHKRYADEDSVILFHDGSTMLNGTTSKVKDTMVWLDELENRLNRIIFKRSNVTENEYTSKKRDEWYLFGDEAMEKGMIDGLIGKDIDIDQILN